MRRLLQHKSSLERESAKADFVLLLPRFLTARQECATELMDFEIAHTPRVRLPHPSRPPHVIISDWVADGTPSLNSLG